MVIFRGRGFGVSGGDPVKCPSVSVGQLWDATTVPLYGHSLSLFGMLSLLSTQSPLTHEVILTDACAVRALTNWPLCISASCLMETHKSKS